MFIQTTIRPDATTAIHRGGARARVFFAVEAQQT
jgi:hypothetical protein